MEPVSQIEPSESGRRDIIYQGVNGVNDRLEMITLWNDLRCTKTVKKMSVSL